MWYFYESFEGFGSQSQPKEVTWGALK